MEVLSATYGINPPSVILSIPETLVDFMPHLHVPLLGARNFLSQFVLTMDYPKKRFLIEIP